MTPRRFRADRFRWLRAYLRARGSRGWGATSLGPNEARLVFDGALAVAAGVAATAFLRVFAPATPASAWPVVLLPAMFLAGNVVAGLYTRLKLASPLRKGLALGSSVTAAGAVACAIGVLPATIVLWTLLTLPMAVLARVLLGLPYGRRAPLTALAASPHGPVLVIGGGGYIGAPTVELLLRTGHRVRVLDRLMYGAAPLAEFAGSPNFELVEGDATDIAKLAGAMRHASAVIHLAGLVGDPACAIDLEFTRHANVIATRMAKEVAHSLDVRRFIFASSCSVYGASEGAMREEDEVRPVSLYAQTKVDSERELLFSVRDNFFVTILRFATVFGHSARPRFDLVANLFAAQAMTNGVITVRGAEQWRPFVHVRDLARAIVTVLEAPAEGVQSQVYNVGDDDLNMTIGQLAELVRRTASRYRSVAVTVDPSEDRRTYRVSFDKIRSQLGFRAEITLEAGIGEMVEQFRAGRYRDFRNPIYSNAATTQAALPDFQSAGDLYAPRRAG